MTFPETNFKDRRDEQALLNHERSVSSSDHQQTEIKARLGATGTIISSDKDLQFGSYQEPPSLPESSNNPTAVTNSVMMPASSPESSKSVIAVTNFVKETVSSPESSKSPTAVANSLKEFVSSPESSRNPIVVTNSIGSYKESVSSSESSRNHIAVINPISVTNSTAVTNSFGSYKDRLSSTESSKIPIAVTTNPIAVANSIGNSSRQVVQWPRPPGTGANQVRYGFSRPPLCKKCPFCPNPAKVSSFLV